MKRLTALVVFLIVIMSAVAVFYPEPWGNDQDAGNNNLINVNNITTENINVGSGTEWLSIYLTGTTGYFDSIYALDFTSTVGFTKLAGTYSNGQAYVCVWDNGTIFAKDSACS